MAAWGWHFARAGSPGWAVAGVLAIPAAHGWVLACEFALAAWVNRGDGLPRTPASVWLAAWWGEWRVAVRVFGWRQPFRSRAIADWLAGPTADGGAASARSRGVTGVLLVHGYLCNRGLWNPWLASLRRQRVPFIAVDLEPVFGSIDDYTATLDDAVERLFAVTGTPVLVVAHSMGGLAVRAWLAARRGEAAGGGGLGEAAKGGRLGEAAEGGRLGKAAEGGFGEASGSVRLGEAAGGGRRSRVRHVITIGSPHRGTLLARFGRSHSARQMRLGGEWHAELAGREPAAFERFTCFHSRCDNVVFPTSTSTLPGADNRHLAGSGHLQLVYRPEVFAAVQRWIDADGGARRAGRSSPAS